MILGKRSLMVLEKNKKIITQSLISNVNFQVDPSQCLHISTASV